MSYCRYVSIAKSGLDCPHKAHYFGNPLVLSSLIVVCVAKGGAKHCSLSIGQ